MLNNRKHFICLRIIVVCVIVSIYFNLSAAGIIYDGELKPFRVALVIGDQWDDPASYLINLPEPTGKYSGYDARPDVQGASDFHDLAVLLKSWAIPFDIIRLDQQLLDRYIFLDMHDNPVYGTIIWDVNESKNLMPSDISVITEMVTEYGTGLIAIADRITQPSIQRLLGVKYIGGWESNDPFSLTMNHFIISGLKKTFTIEPGPENHAKRQQVEVLDALTIVRQGEYPQVTVREFPSGGRSVWIGNDHNNLFTSQELRTILCRSITWTIGYNLFRTWENEIVMIMDDPGGAQNAWLKHWHYAPLSEQDIEKYLIAPLQKHKAVLNINFVPAFVNDEKKRLEPTWNQKFTDEFGLEHDNISSKRGYDKGIRLGVFEVMAHGLTHIQPDLVSDPTWYGSELEKERSEVGWYREFGDTRRGGEIPAAEQLWRMKTGMAWIKEQFGVTPLQFCAGGLGTSVSYFNNTAKLAGQAGYGWCGWETGYLGKDVVITGWKFFGTRESPLFVAALPDAHDYGLTREPEKFASIFKDYPGKRFIGINEFIGYLHAENSAKWEADGKRLTIMTEYDPHYCMDFAGNPTHWNLEISDWLLAEKGGKYSVKADGGKAEIRNSMITIPEGTGKHSITIDFTGL
ncbi:MAG: hypothetical protein GYA41_10625 [Bacteroidales bacterium]|nr:hypothetical protein [Bacteroidales bacterium]